MDGRVNEHYNCPCCVYLFEEQTKRYCYEGFPNRVIELTSKNQCRKCDSWSSHDFDKFMMFEINGDIKKRLTIDEIKHIWEAGRESGKKLFLYTEKLGR